MEPALSYNLAATYSHMVYHHTTIGATVFHFRVRDGTGWFHHAMVTRGRTLCSSYKCLVMNVKFIHTRSGLKRDL